VAEQLKHFFGERVVRQVAADLRRAHPALSERAFVAACLAGLDALELIARGWHIAEVMRAHLPARFPEAAEVLVASLGPELEPDSGLGMEPFRYLPHVLFVQKYGLEDFEPAMRAQYELTKRFSAESSIRAYLERHPEATYARLVEWTSDPSPHVRRLVSEGTRPRLPWARRLRAFQQDPAPVLALLERLRDAPERYVQRSVANNLNDIAKDHPDLVVETCARWLHDASPGRAWIVGHALRSLVKRGHVGALGLLGAGVRPRVAVERVRITPRRVRIGGRVELGLRLRSTARSAQSLVVDYAVHFVKANGTTRPKVFKLMRVRLGAGETVSLKGSVSFAPMTTRRHYPGPHRLELRVNGVAYPLGEVRLSG
jgi:3-methyladenine DNA glycosylase AlkC